MIKYFRIKKKPDGTNYLYLREKNRKFEKAKETYLSKKQNLLILGIEASGKSARLQTIIKAVDLLWKNEEKIIFKATDSLSEILHKNLPDEGEARTLLISEDGEELELDTSKQYIKFQALAQKAKKATLIIDDIDKLTGKKLELTKDLVRNCKRFVATAKDENTINRTLHNLMFRKRQKVLQVQLTSKASVDATNILFALFLLGLMISGMPEMAMLVMMGRFVMKGTK
jgi:hypothetical protein